MVRLVERCLKREPSERFESGSGLLEAMAAAGLASSGLVSSGHLRKWAPAYLAGCLVAVVLGVLIWQGAGSARPARYSGPLTVAVQPFADLTAGGKSAGIAEGLAADLLTRLGGLPGLRLIRSRKVGPDRLKAYGDSLSAQYFVTGHVQSDPENLRVFASLYDVADGSLRWTGSFDRAADRPLDVQSEIAEAIVGKLALELTQDDLAQLGRENGPNLLAQDAYLRGMSLVLNRTPGDLAAAAAHFFESTQLDPNFPDAWSGYAYSRMLEAGTAYSPEKGSDDYEDARAAALHALRLDPRQALAMTTLASIYSEFDWDVEKADSAFALAIAENPNSAEARHLHASHLAESGRLQLALAEQRLAGLLDPESLIHPTNLGLIQFYRRDNEASLRAFDEVIERDPTFYMAHLNRSLLMVAMGQPEASLESLSKAERLVGPQPVVRSLQASALAAAGKESESREILAELSELAETRYVSAPLFAQIYLALSDTSRALDYLELGLRDHDVYLTVMRPWPFLDVVRDNPRFQRVLEGMGRE
ncbi:MAG: adenylate cyclase [Rhodothermales bacterium]